MAVPRAGPGTFSVLSLGQSRSLLARPRLFLLGAGIALAYAFIAMLVGGMLTVFVPPAHVASYWVVLTWGSPWWNYPGILAVNPYFALALPFLPTVFMVLTSAGVGLGMTVAIVLSWNLLARRRAGSGRSAAVGTAAGLTPAMIALVTLGACCSTTAAATAGIGITAQATGTSTGTLLLNTWYLGVFQLVILYVALLAQEQLLRIYGSGLSTRPLTAGMAVFPPLDRRFAAGAALRVLLLAGGVTWCLAVVADWLTVSPGTASAGAWAGWFLQHFLVGSIAIAVAFVPGPMLRAVERWARSWAGLVFRALLVLGGVSLAVGLPPPIASIGLHGFVNELLGTAGVAGSMGAVAPGLPTGVALFARWLFQYLLLGGFAVVLGLRPEAALRPILWTAPRLPDPSQLPVEPVPTGPSVPEGRIALTPDGPR